MGKSWRNATQNDFKNIENFVYFAQFCLKNAISWTHELQHPQGIYWNKYGTLEAFEVLYAHVTIYGLTIS